MGTTKRILYALLRMTISLVMSVIVPLLLFRSIKEFPAIMGMEITLQQQVYEQIIFWIVSMGMLTVSLTFGKLSSPKRSPRRAIFGILNVLISCLYIYSYKYSGASQISYAISTIGVISFDVGTMLNLWMGLIFLKIILEIYDLIDGIIYQKKAKELIEEEISTEFGKKRKDNDEISEIIEEDGSKK